MDNFAFYTPARLGWGEIELAELGQTDWTQATVIFEETFHVEEKQEQ